LHGSYIEPHELVNICLLSMKTTFELFIIAYV